MYIYNYYLSEQKQRNRTSLVSVVSFETDMNHLFPVITKRSVGKCDPVQTHWTDAFVVIDMLSVWISVKPLHNTQLYSIISYDFKP